MRKMLLKLATTAFPVTLNPTYQLLGWMGPGSAGCFADRKSFRK